jgi:hypothetical protein
VIEVIEPGGIEIIKAVVRAGVHLFECLVEEVVQFIAATVVAATFTWAWCCAGLGVLVIGISLDNAAIVVIIFITAC